jgi:hypothetical protein
MHGAWLTRLSPSHTLAPLQALQDAAARGVAVAATVDHATLADLVQACSDAQEEGQPHALLPAIVSTFDCAAEVLTGNGARSVPSPPGLHPIRAFSVGLPVPAVVHARHCHPAGPCWCRMLVHSALRDSVERLQSGSGGAQPSVQLREGRLGLAEGSTAPAASSNGATLASRQPAGVLVRFSDMQAASSVLPSEQLKKLLG